MREFLQGLGALLGMFGAAVFFSALWELNLGLTLGLIGMACGALLLWLVDVEETDGE